MSHLGTTVSALVDGQLRPADAERVLAHVAACPACAEEVAAAREARRVVLSAFDVPANPDLTRRLLALGDGATRRRDGTRHPVEPAGGPPRREPSRPDAGRDVRFDDSLPMPGSALTPPRADWTDCLSGDLQRRHGSRRWLVAATTGVGVVAASLFVLGQQPQVAPSAHPAHALTVLGRAAGLSSGVEPVGDPTVWAVGGGSDASAPWNPSVTTVSTVGASAPPSSGDLLVGSSAALPFAVGAELEHEIDEAAERVLGWIGRQGWSAPSSLPEGYRIAAVRLDPEGPESVEMDLAGTRGLVVVTLQRGRLDPDVVGDAVPTETDGGTLHVLSNAPWHAVWQADDTVVSVVAQQPSVVLDELVVAFPVRDYDAGPVASIHRGWHALTGAWSR